MQLPRRLLAVVASCLMESLIDSRLKWQSLSGQINTVVAARVGGGEDEVHDDDEASTEYFTHNLHIKFAMALFTFNTSWR